MDLFATRVDGEFRNANGRLDRDERAVRCPERLAKVRVR
jgi:hypothetical protein